jgi:hypothetical protein
LPKPSARIHSLCAVMKRTAEDAVLPYGELNELYVVIARLGAVANVDFHARRDLMSIARIRKDIGFEAKYDLPRALEDYLAWCRSAQTMTAA